MRKPKPSFFRHSKGQHSRHGKEGKTQVSVGYSLPKRARVLSEFEGDKFEFTQMHAANDFRAAIEQLLYRKELK